MIATCLVKLIQPHSPKISSHVCMRLRLSPTPVAFLLYHERVDYVDRTPVCREVRCLHQFFPVVVARKYVYVAGMYAAHDDLMHGGDAAANTYRCSSEGWPAYLPIQPRASPDPYCCMHSPEGKVRFR